MLRDYGSFLGNHAVKRNIHHFGNDSQKCSKRLKNNNNTHYWHPDGDGICKNNFQPHQLHYQQLREHAEQQQPAPEDQQGINIGFLTPAATPADLKVENVPSVEESTSSPYSEAEDYMVRGYYEDENLVYNNRSCVESLQYNLYDMTPEELELANDSLHFDNRDIDSTRWDGADGRSTNWQSERSHITLHSDNNEAIYDDSYDIDM